MGIDVFYEGKWKKSGWKGTWKEAQETYPNFLKRRKVRKKYEYTKLDAASSQNPRARKWAS